MKCSSPPTEKTGVHQDGHQRRGLLSHAHHRRGLACELAVEQAFLQKGFTLVEKRFETPFGELDLLMKSPSGRWIALEVKSRNREGVLEFRVGRPQMRRLRRIHEWLILKKSGTRFMIAFVNPKNRIKLLELSDC